MSSKTKTTAPNEKGKPALFPKLRFLEFQKEPAWPAHMLAEVCDLNKGEQLAASAKDAGGRYPHYNGGISPSSYTGKANREANTIIISEGGNSCGYVQFVTEPFWSGGHNYSLAVKQKVETLCLFYALQAKQREIMALRIGSGLPNIQKSTLGQFEVCLSQLIAEQRRVAECLSSVDELMAAQARKVDALKAHKKGLMQQLFPGEGESQPRLRFPEFQNAGEWARMSIQEMIDKRFIIGHLDGNHGELYPKAEEFSQNKEGIPYISANDFMNGSVEFSKCKRLPIERARLFKKGVAKDGDILFAHNATVGPVAKLNTAEEFVILSTTATYFRCNNKHLSNDFLQSALSSPDFVAQYSRVMSQSTRNQVPITTQRKLELHLPNPPEQERIAACLSSLNALITAETQKHEALKTHNKGLLQQLFPSPTISTS